MTVGDTDNLPALQREVALIAKPYGAVSNVQQSHVVTALLVRAKVAIGDLKNEQARQLAPHEAEVRRIKARFSGDLAALDSFVFTAKRELAAFTEREAERVRVENQRQLEAGMSDLDRLEAAGEDTAPALEALERVGQQPVSAYRGETGTASTSKKWKGEIVKPEDVPREYCVPHMPLINAAIKLGKREIAGVSITQETQVQVRIRQ